MVILIAGASHTGKTALARRLVKRYGYFCLSLDHLKMGLIRSGYTALTPLSGDRELTGYLWPVAREMIKTAIENEQDLIVEGCYIPFDWQRDLPAEYRARIRYICLVMSEGYIRRHYPEIKAYANVAERRLDDTDCTLETLLRDNARTREACRRYGLEPFLIEDRYPTEFDL